MLNYTTLLYGIIFIMNLGKKQQIECKKILNHSLEKIYIELQEKLNLKNTMGTIILKIYKYNDKIAIIQNKTSKTTTDNFINKNINDFLKELLQSFFTKKYDDFYFLLKISKYDDKYFCSILIREITKN